MVDTRRVMEVTPMMAATEPRTSSLPRPWQGMEPHLLRVVSLSLAYHTDEEIGARLRCCRQTVVIYKQCIRAAFPAGTSWTEVLRRAQADGVEPDGGVR